MSGDRRLMLHETNARSPIPAKRRRFARNIAEVIDALYATNPDAEPGRQRSGEWGE
jgi:hypothetical protein